MEKYLAALMCVWFVVKAFRADVRENPEASSAIWIPLLWMFFAGSRYLSSWLSLGGPGSETSYDEGSPVDRAVFFVLLMSGIVVLARRQIDWPALLGRNKLLALYLLYCLVSVLWSDEPFIGFKRWVKDLGNPVMALIILTDRRPLEALGVLISRLAILWLPLSVLFVRYFPELGRVHHVDGTPLYTGVGHQKNALGQMCLVTGIYFIWFLSQRRQLLADWPRWRKLRFWLLAAMTAYLLYVSNSQTSLSALLLASAALWLSRLSFVLKSPKRLVVLVIMFGASVAALQFSFDLKTVVLEMLGRDPTLTNRTELWSILFDISTNPLVGAGFMSFWAGDRLQLVWTRLAPGVIQAHSGYIEQYLNLGYVGVAFIVLMMANALRSARKQALTQPDFANLRVAIVLAAGSYNYTEAAFYGVNNMWILLLISLIMVPAAVEDQRAPATRPTPTGPGRGASSRSPSATTRR
jgi:exopolysaccharide production protein ExoQ